MLFPLVLFPDHGPAVSPAKKSKLSEYERKRDFSKTKEPGAKPKRGKGKKGAPKRKHPRFAIQKHAATSLHYDLRLEIDGTLASWAVPKGPSLDPRDKRLAMRTEDHPLEYLSWEGVIPKGSYGAGEMIVWDRGVFENISKTRSGKALTLTEALEKGDLKIFLLGEKVKGAYALVRTSDPGDREQWLLIKKKDEGADARRKPTSSQPESVLSGKTIEQLRKEAKG
jgi:DNA ligase D-like protein (predicted 3'-phosphoesterase)